MTYDKCKLSVSASLKKRGFDDYEEKAANMCSMWAEENGVEREFATEAKTTEPVRRTFGISLGEEPKMTFNSDEGVDSVTFPVIAITSGLHTYEEDEKEQLILEVQI